VFDSGRFVHLRVIRGQQLGYNTFVIVRGDQQL